MDTFFFDEIIFPVIASVSNILSISSPNNSILIAFECSFVGIISIMSPWTLKVPLLKSISFLSYNISINFINNWFLSIVWPTLNVSIFFSYSSFSPIPYIHDTDATTITSFDDKRALVAACLSSSISSFIDESFSMYVSVWGL